VAPVALTRFPRAHADMFLYVNQTTQPIVEPVTLDQLKQQCNVDSGFTNDDTLIASYGVAARQYAEKYTRRAFFNQSWKLTLDHFPTYLFSPTVNPAIRRDYYYYAGLWNGMTIAVPKPNCLSIDSITYVDLTGTTQTLSASDYVVDVNSIPARIVPSPGIYWPLNTLYIPGSVVVNFTCGSYVQQFTETLTVPATAPYVYAPHESPVTGVVSIKDGSGNAVKYALTDGELTFQSSQAGATYTLVYYAGTTFPQAISQAIMLLVSHWYVNRESASPMRLTEIPFGVTALLDMYKVSAVLDYESIV
jgi:hypothetical protein